MPAWLGLLVGVALFAGADEAHVLRVPYRNQLDGSPYAAANCGPAALSMLLAYYGIDATPGDLRVRSMQAQHSWVDDEGGYSDRYGVFVYNLATVGETYGLHANGLWQREGSRIDRLHEWPAADLRSQIRLGRPVLVEVRYRLLPRHSGSNAPDDHYIVVHGIVGDDFVYSDPLGRDGVGPDEVISEGDLLLAMSRADVPRVGFALVRPG